MSFRFETEIALMHSGVPRNFFGTGEGVTKIQLRAEITEIWGR
jgi:hypothetical protein